MNLPSATASFLPASDPAPGSVQAYALAEKADATRRTYCNDFDVNQR